MESVPHSDTFDPGEGRGIAILGSTGSIGTQALDVVRAQPGRFRVEVLTAGRNADLLIAQALEFKPNAVAIAAKTAAADAARAAAAAVAAEAAAATSTEPAPLVENHSKVVLGLGKGLGSLLKGKKGLSLGGTKLLSKPASRVFQAAVEEEETAAAAAAAAAEAEAKAGQQALEADQAAMVDWTGLICGFCRRKFKDEQTLRKHTESSELHATNLMEWRTAKEAELNAAASSAGQPQSAGSSASGQGAAASSRRHWPERKEVPSLPFMRPGGGSDGRDDYDISLDKRFGDDRERERDREVRGRDRGHRERRS